ncbi:MAG: transglycosylase domain-containing protein [bacterium]
MKKFLKWLFILTSIAAVCGAVGLAGVFWYFGQDLPQILKRDDYNPPQMTRIYSADGFVIGEFFTPGSKRTVVPEDKIPKHVKEAFMAAEDADFMTHQGIDYLGMVRAFYYAVRYDVGVKGTSTITQQVVKNLILSPEKSLSRKVKEIGFGEGAREEPVQR